MHWYSKFLSHVNNFVTFTIEYRLLLSHWAKHASSSHWRQKWENDISLFMLQLLLADSHKIIPSSLF